MSDRNRVLSLTAAAVLVGAVLLVGAGPASAATTPCGTVDDFEFSCVTDAGFTYAVVTGYTGIQTDLVVPAGIEVGGVDYPVLVIGDGALASKNLTSVVLPDGLDRIDAYGLAFNQLTSVRIPDDVALVGEGSFQSNQLESIDFGSSLAEIGVAAFGGNSRLTELTFPDSLVFIDDAAFYGAHHLTSLAFPAGVVKIGAKAFRSLAEDSELTDVRFTGPAPTLSPATGAASGDDTFQPRDDLRIGYRFAQDSSQGGGFTAPLWQGYHSYAVDVHRVTFDLGGHGDPVDTQMVTSGSTAAEPTEPTESGWRFTGWFTDAALTAAFDFADPVDSDLVLHAGWSSNDLASIELTPESLAADQGDSITITANGFAADGYDLGDITDQVTFSSSVASDTIDGNRIVFNHASSHIITATTPDGLKTSVTITVSPVAAPPGPSTGAVTAIYGPAPRVRGGTSYGSGSYGTGTLPSTGSPVAPLAPLAAMTCVIAGAVLIRTRRVRH